MYDFTVRLAAFDPPRRDVQELLASLPGRQAEIHRFLGVFAGIVPVKQYFSLRNVVRRSPLAAGPQLPLAGFGAVAICSITANSRKPVVADCARVVAFNKGAFPRLRASNRAV